MIIKKNEIKKIIFLICIVYLGYKLLKNNIIVERLKNNMNQPPGKWGKWKTSCTGIGKSEITAHLGKAKGKWIDAAKICLQSDACGTLPKSNSTKSPLANVKIGGAFGTIYNDDDPTCYPTWKPWQKKNCTAMGRSEQSAKLKLPPGVKNTDEIGKQAIEFCSGSGSTKCNNGNKALNVPLYGNDDTFEYNERRINERWATVTLNDDTYCYPAWRKWNPKDCIGYQRAQIQGKLAIPNRKDQKTNKIIKPIDIANFCIEPENYKRCYGPNEILDEHNPIPEDIINKKGTKILPATKGIGEAWAKIQFKDTNLCQPYWEQVKSKSKYQFGIAQYKPTMKFKKGGKFNATKDTCNKLLKDLSYNSYDNFTWTPSGELCKDNTCYPASLLKACTIDGLGWKHGKFLRRDPEYATNMIGIWPWNWPKQISDAISYYKGKATDRIPP